MVNVWEIGFEAADRAILGASSASAPASASASPASMAVASGPVPEEVTAYSPAAWIRALEGGEGGELHRLLLDHFFFAQVQEQGEVTQEPRDIRSSVTIRRLPEILRSLGCFLDEAQIREVRADWGAVYVPGLSSRTKYHPSFFLYITLPIP